MAKGEVWPPPAAGDANGDRHLTRAEGSSPLPRVVCSDELLAGASQLAILHNDKLYFLRETRYGKLILTK